VVTTLSRLLGGGEFPLVGLRVYHDLKQIRVQSERRPAPPSPAIRIRPRIVAVGCCSCASPCGRHHTSARVRWLLSLERHLESLLRRLVLFPGAHVVQLDRGAAGSLDLEAEKLLFSGSRGLSGR
jgi:hypothetical protein